MADEPGDDEDRSAREQQGNGAAEQLAQQATQDDRPGAPGVADRPAQKDQARCADRGQQDDGLQLGVLADRGLDRRQRGAPGLRVEGRREQGDGAGDQRATRDRVDEQLGQERRKLGPRHRPDATAPGILSIRR